MLRRAAAAVEIGLITGLLFATLIGVAKSPQARSGFTSMAPESVEDQYHGTDGNGTVGDVEVGPVEATPVGANKIDHIAQADAVNQVADCAAENQCKGYGGPGGAGLEPSQDGDDDRDHEQGDADEQPALPAASSRQEAESGTGIVDQAEIEQARNDDNTLSHSPDVAQPELDALIQQNDPER